MGLSIKSCVLFDMYTKKKMYFIVVTCSGLILILILKYVSYVNKSSSLDRWSSVGHVNFKIGSRLVALSNFLSSKKKN